MNKNTKIICTIGPASESPEMLERLVRAGMNCVRLNFSHGNYDEFEKIIKNIRHISKKLDTPIGIIQDLQGPKIRVADAPDGGIPVKKNQQVTITTRNVKATPTLIPLDYHNLHKDIKKGDDILIDDGLIELKVVSVKGTEIRCKVLNNGIIKKRKGVNVPSPALKVSSLTKKDLKDLAFGFKHDVDYVALSFVKTAQDIEDLRAIINHHHSSAKIIAKIERPEAVENLEEITKVSDAIMVARGDLGIETPAENVPIVQKQAILLANAYAKPVITATQILNSMIENPRATRAEISDAANAIFDHSDALMLSNETAVGKYPVEAVQTLAKVASATEKVLKQNQHLIPYKQEREKSIANSTCENAAKLALDIKARCIVAVTLSGFTTKHIAKYRLYTPLITLTDNQKVQNQLSLVWGCNQSFTEKIQFQDVKKQVETLLKKNKIAKKGDEVVIVVNASKEEKLISTIVIR